MDSITHIVTGACIGEAFAGKKLGRKAMLWGAVSQSIPDIDFVASFWTDTSSDLLAHRGFTHSILFALIIVPVMAMLAERWHRPHNISIKRWSVFLGFEVFVHLFLDGFNAYGTGYLEPFTHDRFSFNTIFVADPFFTIVPAIACIALLFVHRKNIRARKIWWRLGVFSSSAYLLYCIFNKVNIDSDARTAFKKQNISYTKYFTTPTALNNWLWYIVAGDGKGFYIGYRSVFDSKDSIHFTYFPKNDSMLGSMANLEEVQHLKRFSQGYYTIENWNGVTVMNDLRFGQIVGWQDPNEKFVFHYFLQRPLENEMVVQRGRFAKWDMNAVESLIRRIKGN